MSGTTSDLVEEIVANVYQDGVFVVRNGRHRTIEPGEVAKRWADLIQGEKDGGRFSDSLRHGERLYAWIRGHQVAFVWMDLDEPSPDHRGDWRQLDPNATSW